MSQCHLEDILGLTRSAPSLKPTVHLLQCPSCLRVSFSPVARWRAARALVRPREVSDLFTPVPSFLLSPGYSVAGSIAEWLRDSFINGTLKYRPDPPGADIWCSPTATRWTGGGDCDDLAILGASMIAYAGGMPQLAIGYYCNGNSCDGHAWVEGQDGRGWFLLEATSGQLYRSGRPKRYVVKQLIQPKLMR